MPGAYDAESLSATSADLARAATESDRVCAHSGRSQSSSPQSPVVSRSSHPRLWPAERCRSPPGKRAACSFGRGPDWPGRSAAAGPGNESRRPPGRSAWPGRSTLPGREVLRLNAVDFSSSIEAESLGLYAAQHADGEAARPRLAPADRPPNVEHPWGRGSLDSCAVQAAREVDGQRQTKWFQAVCVVSLHQPLVDRPERHPLPRIAFPGLLKGSEVILDPAGDAVKCTQPDRSAVPIAHS